MKRFKISEDLTNAQEKFITRYNIKESSVTTQSNIFEVCYKNEPIQNGNRTYHLQTKENYTTEDQYYKQYYYKRRSGVGKYRILNF